jgi:glycosyltransferase involved in cell wall biosynthesis
MGTPVVSTDTGQISSIIESGETGILVYPPTVTAFSEAIETLQSSPENYRAMSALSRDKVLNQHSWLGNATHVMAVCDELLASVQSSPKKTKNAQI